MSDSSANDVAGGLQTVPPGHADVHQHHVGPELARLRHGLHPVRSLTHHLDVVLGVQDHPEPIPNQRLVVDQQDADHVPPSQRQPGAHQESAARGRAGFQLAPVQGNPFAHPNQSVPFSGTGVGRPAAIVGDLELEGLMGEPNHHLDVYRTGVLERVGQRLLDDAKRREVDTRRQRMRVADHLELNIQPGLAQLRQQQVEVGDPRLGREAIRGFGLAQDPEQPAHVGQRGAPGLLDTLHRFAGPIGAGPVEHLVGSLGLDNHDADIVRHDVVQLAGDASALGSHRGRGAVVALADRLRGTPAHFAKVGADEPCDQDRRHPAGSRRCGPHGGVYRVEHRPQNGRSS